MKTMLIIFLCAEIAAGYFHIFAKASKKSPLTELLSKALCSSIFVAVCCFAALASDGFGAYEKLILVGAVFGLAGDVLLAVGMKDFWFVSGLSSFLIGHIFYIIAFVKASTAIWDDYRLVTVLDIAVLAVFMPIVFIVGHRLKAKVGALLPAIVLYMAVISTMLAKAVRLSICLISAEGIASAIVPAVLLTLGSMLFVSSDSVLAMKTFTEAAPKCHKTIVMTTYLAAQTMISLSVYFVSI